MRHTFILLMWWIMTNHFLSIMGWVSRATDDKNGIFNYPLTQISYYIPYQMQGQVETNTWVNLEFPIHGEVVGRSQETYVGDVHN